MKETFKKEDAYCKAGEKAGNLVLEAVPESP